MILVPSKIVSMRFFVDKYKLLQLSVFFIFLTAAGFSVAAHYSKEASLEGSHPIITLLENGKIEFKFQVRQQALNSMADGVSESLAKKEAERLAVIAAEEARIAEEARVNRIRIPMAEGWYVTDEWGMRCGVPGVYEGCLHHSGIDFGNGPTYGQAFYPSAKGVVSYKSSFGGIWPSCGNYVAVWHEHLNKTTMYCHMDEIWVNEGQWVDPDSALGTVGNTGMSAGIHLHFNVYHGNQLSSGDYNPRDFFAEYGIVF